MLAINICLGLVILNTNVVNCCTLCYYCDDYYSAEIIRKLKSLRETPAISGKVKGDEIIYHIPSVPLKPVLYRN